MRTQSSLYALLIICLSLISFNASARIELHEFENKQQEALYNKMIDELRCLVCQNQNLADSNAELAVDLREKTYEMVMQNKSEKDIVEYMVDRYGDFVLYKPPFKINTLVLWVGPFLLLAIAIYFAMKIIKQSGRNDDGEKGSEETSAKTEADHESVRKLLDQDDEEDKK